MSLFSDLNSIYTIKQEIKSAIESKGVDMTSYSFPDYPTAIGEIQTGSITDKDITEKALGIVNLSNSAAYVGSYAFIYDTSIQTVNLPDASYVGDHAFSSANVQEVDLSTCSVIMSSGFYRCMVLSYANLPGCKNLSDQVFYNCNNLTFVSLPICETINRSTFYYCQKLESISLPSCITIGQAAFANCASLSIVYLPKVNSFGTYTFSGCTSLTDFTMCTETYVIPDYVSNMFTNSPILTGGGSIYVDAGQYSYFIVANGWSSLVDRFVSVGSDSTPMIGLSDGVLYGKTTSISGNFYNMYPITKNDILSISLPECKTVSPTTFQNCTSLTAVSLPSCEYVPSNTFGNCYSLQSVYCPSCTSISKTAFSNCSSLVNLYMPLCEYVGTSAFINCISLESLDLPACKSIGSYAFKGCSSLNTISLPVCEYITERTFSENVVETLSLPACSYIGQYAFADDHSLSYVNLSVCSTIDQYAFYNCWSLTTVVLGYSSVVSAINNNAFTNDQNITGIYVPASLVDAYKTAGFWNYYSSIIFPISE